MAVGERAVSAEIYPELLVGEDCVEGNFLDGGSASPPTGKGWDISLNRN